MGSVDLHLNRLNNLRRSQRVCLNVPVVILKPDPGKPTVSEETHTQIVSAHGALLLLAMPVKPGDLLTMKHKKTQEQLVCRVINAGPDQSGKKEVGVEFEQPSPRFWRIAFPPADWNPRGPDSKPPTRQVPGVRPPQRKPASTPADPPKTRADKAPGPATR